MREKTTAGKPGTARDNTVGVYLRLLHYAIPYLWRIALAMLFGLCYGAANGGIVKFVQDGSAVFEKANLSEDRFVLVAVVGLPLVAMLRGLFDFFSAYHIKWVGNRVVMDLRNSMYEHLHLLPVSYFSKSRTGELISRVSNDTQLIERAVSTVLADLAKQPVTLIVMLVVLFKIDAGLAGAALLVFPLFILPVAAFGKRVRRNARKAQSRVADFVSILQETVSGIRIVKAFGMESYEIGKFEKQTGAFFKKIVKVARASAAVEPVVVFIGVAGISGLLFYVSREGMNIGQFFGFSAALFLAYEPVKKLSQIHIRIQQSSAAADRIFELLDTMSDVVDSPEARELEGPVERVGFENISFAYEGGEPVIDGIDLDVKAGERIAFVGSSGAGKTTLVNLIPRFYDVTNGTLTVNGIDVAQLTMKSLRAKIGLVTQETFLFNDSVAGNIGYGSHEVTRDQVMDAARRANAHDFIMEMPDGYDTVIGERGVRLSGGQRQRLAIARAILRNPPILILDEATSALDTESERMVQAALDELMSGRTVFAIAHRLSTITNCDRIVVLDKGRIVEQGTHDELLAAGGTYKRLYDLQFDTESAG